MARDYALNATVPNPKTPIGEVEVDGKTIPVFCSDEWRRTWFEPVGVSLYGETGGEDVTQAIGSGGIVTLGVGTSGSYVEDISGDPTRGLNVAGGAGEGANNAITIAQDIQITASPEFADLTITGSGTISALFVSVAGKVTKDATITAPETAHTINAVFDNAEVQTALDNLGAVVEELRQAMNA